MIPNSELTRGRKAWFKSTDIPLTVVDGVPDERSGKVRVLFENGRMVWMHPVDLRPRA